MRKHLHLSTEDTLAICNLRPPKDGDEIEAIKKVLAAINVDEFYTAAMKNKIMKRKHELRNHSDSEISNAKIMNYKTPL